MFVGDLPRKRGRGMELEGLNWAKQQQSGRFAKRERLEINSFCLNVACGWLRIITRFMHGALPKQLANSYLRLSILHLLNSLRDRRSSKTKRLT